MESYDLDTFKLLDRYRYLRSNFIAAYHIAGDPNGSMQHRKRDLGDDKNGHGLTARRLLAHPVAQEKSKNYRYSTRVYELTDKSKTILKSNGITPTKWKG